MLYKIDFRLLSIFLLAINISLSGQDNHLNESRQTKLLAGSTAELLPKGKSIASSVDLIYHTIDIGISKNFNLGTGLIYFPKLTVPTGVLKFKIGHELDDNLSLAVSSNWLVPLNSREDFTFIAPTFGLVTLKIDEISITGGFGIILSDEDLSLTAQLGAIFPITHKISIVSENYWGYDPTDNYYEDNFFMVGVGFRYDLKNWMIDAGVVSAVLIGGDGNAIAPFPLLGIAYLF